MCTALYNTYKYIYVLYALLCNCVLRAAFVSAYIWVVSVYVCVHSTFFKRKVNSMDVTGTRIRRQRHRGRSRRRRYSFFFLIVVVRASPFRRRFRFI